MGGDGTAGTGGCDSGERANERSRLTEVDASGGDATRGAGEATKKKRKRKNGRGRSQSGMQATRGWTNPVITGRPAGGGQETDKLGVNRTAVATAVKVTKLARTKVAVEVTAAATATLTSPQGLF